MRIYLAGGVPENKSKYRLVSFMEGEKRCREHLAAVGRDNFLLDSGVFSMLNSASVKIELSTYLDSYIAFIIKHDVRYFFEMDMYDIVGVEKTEAMRYKIESETGRPSIPVWHKSLGVDYWKRLVREYDYIAVAGFASRDVKANELPAIQRMVDYAYRRGVRVHGLGFTKTKIIKQFKFYSVDSATWLLGAVRGSQRHTFSGYDMITKQLQSNGYKANQLKLSEHNMKEWVKYQKHMEGINE